MAKKRGSHAITDMQIFYFSWLRKNRPELLTFKCQGYQWQVVWSWLQRDEDRNWSFGSPWWRDGPL